jgi:hypothetical protein
MNRLLFTAALALPFLLGSCAKKSDAVDSVSQTSEEKVSTYGKKFISEGAIAPAEITSLLVNKDSVQAKVATNVLEVCQAKGCWMNVAVEGQEPMRVTFKNYGFFMPKDIVGKEVVFEGVALRDTVSVEDQRHFAEDAGKSKEEIAANKTPKPSITFVANGVQVKQ